MQITVECPEIPVEGGEGGGGSKKFRAQKLMKICLFTQKKYG